MRGHPRSGKGPFLKDTIRKCSARTDVAVNSATAQEQVFFCFFSEKTAFFLRSIKLGDGALGRQAQLAGLDQV
jgi:hypothetical protein